MTDKDKTRFASILGGMAEVYGKEISKQALALHFMVLSQFSVEQVQEAALSILANRKYTSMPTPADFVEHIAGGSTEDQAEIEAGKVLEAIGMHGSYSSVAFDDPNTLAVIRQAYGGWVKLCEECGVEEPEKWFRHNFAKTWAAYRRQGVQQFGYLPGRAEIQNTANGHLRFIPPPSLVGNPEKAKFIISEGNTALVSSKPLALSDFVDLPPGAVRQ